MAKYITYEQPLNELIRLCLRLEHLFKLIDTHLQQDSIPASRATLTALLDILNVVERPDLKVKLVKALGHHANQLSRYESSKDVDQSKLASYLNELDKIIDVLHSQPGRIGQSLKDNEFLSTIRQRLSIPAGDSNFYLPSYQRWLSQSPIDRQAQLQAWRNTLSTLHAAISTLIKLTRQSAKPSTLSLQDSFYQQSLDTNIDWQLVRITLDFDSQLYPEVSVGRHRLNIRFHTLNPHGRPATPQLPLACVLTLCSS